MNVKAPHMGGWGVEKQEMEVSLRLRQKIKVKRQKLRSEAMYHPFAIFAQKLCDLCG